MRCVAIMSLLLAASVCFVFVEARLLTVQMVGRHGTRAPKASLAAVCPAYNNWHHYDAPEALTGAGMMQMYQLGRDVRSRYVDDMKFLSPRYNYREIYVRSSDSPRCMQSASAFGMGLYPDGTGLKGFLSHRPTLVPIHGQVEHDDDLLDSRKAHCQSRVKSDGKAWLRTTGQRLIEQHNHTLELMSRLCQFDMNSIWTQQPPKPQPKLEIPAEIVEANHEAVHECATDNGLTSQSSNCQKQGSHTLAEKQTHHDEKRLKKLCSKKKHQSDPECLDYFASHADKNHHDQQHHKHKHQEKDADSKHKYHTHDERHHEQVERSVSPTPPAPDSDSLPVETQFQASTGVEDDDDDDGSEADRTRDDANDDVRMDKDPEHVHLHWFQKDHDYSGDLPTAVKDLADALIFDRLEGLTPAMPGLEHVLPNETESVWTMINQFAFRMFYSRYFDKPEKVVYLSGKLPHRLMKNFNHAVKADPKKARKLYSYHTHRDLMYAAADFFGILFEGPGVMNVPGVPQGFIPPSTAFFLELHQPAENEKSSSPEPFVRVFLWLPCNLTQCPFTPIHLKNCAQDCPLSEFMRIMHQRISANGDWMKLCSRVSRETLYSSVGVASNNFRRFQFLAEVGVIGMTLMLFGLIPAISNSSLHSSSLSIFIFLARGVCLSLFVLLVMFEFEVTAPRSHNSIDHLINSVNVIFRRLFPSK